MLTLSGDPFTMLVKIEMNYPEIVSTFFSSSKRIYFESLIFLKKLQAHKKFFPGHRYTAQTSVRRWYHPLFLKGSHHMCLHLLPS